MRLGNTSPASRGRIMQSFVRGKKTEPALKMKLLMIPPPSSTGAHNSSIVNTALVVVWMTLRHHESSAGSGQCGSIAALSGVLIVIGIPYCN